MDSFEGDYFQKSSSDYETAPWVSASGVARFLLILPNCFGSGVLILSTCAEITNVPIFLRAEYPSCHTKLLYFAFVFPQATSKLKLNQRKLPCWFMFIMHYIILFL
jgi:hypothetical protein